MFKKIYFILLLFSISQFTFSQVNINTKGIIATFPVVADSLKLFVDSTFYSCGNKSDSNTVDCMITKGFECSGLNFNKSASISIRAFQLSFKNKYYMETGRSLILMGNSYFWLSKYDKALFYYFEALSIFQQMKDEKKQAWVMHEIGILYSKNGRGKDAKNYYLSSLNLYIKNNEEEGMAMSYGEIGTAYEYENNFSEAMSYYVKSYNLYRKMHSDLGSSYGADYIAGIFSQQNNFDSAIYYENISLDLRIKVKDKHAESISINNLGEIYFAKKDYKKALDCFKRSTSLAKLHGFIDLEQYGYDYLSKCYNELGDYKNAFLYQKRHAEMKDSMFNDSRAKQLSELQTKYETEKKDNEIKTLQGEKTISSLKISEQNLILQKRNYLLALVLLILIVLLSGSYFYYSRLKLKNQLAKEKAIKETEEHERMRIAKDIHDDLGSGLSKINFLSEIIYGKSEHLPEIRHSSESVKETAKRMIDNMRDLIWALNPDNTTLPNLIARMREYTTDYLEDFPIEIKYSFPDNVPQTSINKESHRELFMIVKETLNNISKHSKATEILFNVNITNDNFSFSIRDNGIGFNEETIKRGNGLRNMNSRITALGGIFEVKSEPNKYTLIAVSVPLQKIIKT